MAPVQQHVRRAPDSSFNLFRLRAGSGGRFWHRHPEDEVLVLRRGRCWAEVGDRRWLATGPCLVWVGADLPHSWQFLEPAGVQREAWILQVPAATWRGLGDGLAEGKPLRRLRRRARAGLIWTGVGVAELADDLMALADRSGLARLAGLLVVCDQLARRRASPVLRAEAAGVEDPRLAGFLRWLQEQLDAPIGLDGAAARLGLSRSQTTRFLRRQLGCSFVQLVQRLRIERACRLLTESRTSITAIGYRVGFGTQAQFNRVFKRLVGCSPRAYRRR